MWCQSRLYPPARLSLSPRLVICFTRKGLMASQVFENERRFPLVGWRGLRAGMERGNFSDEKGNAAPNMADYPCPPGFHWIVRSFVTRTLINAHRILRGTWICHGSARTATDGCTAHALQVRARLVATVKIIVCRSLSSRGPHHRLGAPPPVDPTHDGASSYLGMPGIDHWQQEERLLGESASDMATSGPSSLNP